MNGITIALIVIAGLVFSIFLTIRNAKDGRKFKKQLMDDYPKSKEREGEMDEGRMRRNKEVGKCYSLLSCAEW